jgi:hypothetical protein
LTQDRVVLSQGCQMRCRVEPGVDRSKRKHLFISITSQYVKNVILAGNHANYAIVSFAQSYKNGESHHLIYVNMDLFFCLLHEIQPLGTSTQLMSDQTR